MKRKARPESARECTEVHDQADWGATPRFVFPLKLEPETWGETSRFLAWEGLLNTTADRETERGISSHVFPVSP